MRRRLSERVVPRSVMRRAAVAVAAIGAALAFAPGAAQAQGGAEGVFLLLPVGARAVGMGEAVVAQQGGSDALWWNPAAIGGTTKHEIGIHHAETVGQDNALAAVLPFAHVGTFGLSLNVLDLGRQDATDDQGNIQGVITPTDFEYGLTYAAAPLPVLSLGATIKHVEARTSCSGLCANLPAGGSRSNGADVGAQIRPAAGSPLTIGFAARNLGVGGGDTRPARLDAGADYRFRLPPQYADLVEIHAAVGVVSTAQFDSATTHVGADIALEQRVHVRAGYIHDPVNGSGGAVGVGLSSGKLVFDLARTFGELSANSDKPPTYFSLRYVW